MTGRRRVRKLGCHHRPCPRRRCTERWPGLVAPWARRTRRVAARRLAMGLALGAAAGARLSQSCGRPVRRNTRWRVSRRAPCPIMGAPHVRSGDEVALRKRHPLGTLRVARTRRRPLALLPDREATTVAPWREAHPGGAGPSAAPSGGGADRRVQGPRASGRAGPCAPPAALHARARSRRPCPRAPPCQRATRAPPALHPRSGRRGGPPPRRSGGPLGRGGRWRRSRPTAGAVGVPCRGMSRARRALSGRRGLAVAAASRRTKPPSWPEGTAGVALAGPASGRAATRGFRARTGWGRGLSAAGARRHSGPPGSAGATSPSRQCRRCHGAGAPRVGPPGWSGARQQAPRRTMPARWRRCRRRPLRWPRRWPWRRSAPAASAGASRPRSTPG
jgi:hypothetical protein